MIIKKLHIDGFGIFKDHSIDNFKPGINLLYGRNESGKSTLLDFIRFTLFGYPRPLAERRPPLQGGKHGGRIEVLLKNQASSSSIYRSAKNDILFSHKGQEYDKEQIWKKYLDHAESDLYTKIYGITLDELTEKDNLTQSQMKDRIFSMGLGLADVKLGEVHSELNKRSEEIYVSQGRKKRLNLIGREMETLRREINSLQGTVKQFDEINAELKSIDSKRVQLDETIDKYKRKLRHLEILLSVFDAYVEYRHASQQIDNIPDFDRIPKEVLSSCSESKQKLQITAKELQDLQFDLEKCDRELNSLELNPLYEENLDLANRIQENIRLTEAAIEAKNHSQHQITAYETRQSEILKSWGSEIDRESLLEFDSMNLLMNRGKEIQEALNDCESVLMRRKDRLNELKPKQAELEAESRSLISRRDSLEIQSSEQNEKALKKVQELAVQREKLGLETSKSNTSVSVWVAVLVMGGVLILSGFISANWDIFGILQIAIGLLLFALAIFFMLKRNTGESSIQDWEEINQKEKRIETEIEYFKNFLEKENDWKQRQVALEETKKQLQNEINELEEQKIKFLEEWQALIQDTPIPNHWSAKLFLDAERDLSEYLEKERLILSEKEKLADSDNQIREFELLLKPFDTVDKDKLISTARKILEQFETTREILDKKKTIMQRRTEIQSRVKAKNVSKNQLEEQIQAWEETYLKDNNEWPDQVEVQNHHDEWVEKRDEAKKAMERLTGPDALSDTMHRLQESNKIDLQDSKEVIEEQLIEAERNRSELTQQSGRLQQKIDELSSPDDLQKKESQMASLKTQMRDAQWEWLSYRLAEDVLRESQQHFEREKQPRVIQNSERYFQTITNGRYQRIELSIMDSDIRLETQTGKKKKIEHLSRGTREQLLLALRLGLIEEYEEKAEDLPVALDDVFVNFDAQRASQTAEVMASFSKSRQVIIFTCHSSTVELFTPYNANILDWNPDPDHFELPKHLTRPSD
ncbi:MAG: AAA family ATPase [Bacteroidetes bacterium]|jgi:uncharacterized protein YhaN|nr:AAA family ATPase [Bacteroidota bacterium]